MTFEYLIYEVNDAVATIRLNRPDVYNALHKGILVEIKQAIEQANLDTTVRVVILTGVGNKAFSSGADLKANSQSSPESLDLPAMLRENYHPTIMAIRELPKPVICRLNGIAAGAGCSLALACDIIVAADSATLTQIFVNIGLVPDAGSTYFLPQRIGMAKAFELCSMGRSVGAAEALAMGLVNEVVPAEELDNAVGRWSKQYAQAPTKAIGLIKLGLNSAFRNSLEEMLEIEANNQGIASQTHDFGEGVMAFLQKRKAKFKGK